MKNKRNLILKISTGVVLLVIIILISYSLNLSQSVATAGRGIDINYSKDLLMPKGEIPETCHSYINLIYPKYSKSTIILAGGGLQELVGDSG